MHDHKLVLQACKIEYIGELNLDMNYKNLNIPYTLLEIMKYVIEKFRITLKLKWYAGARILEDNEMLA